jgi:hypothetical protein
MQNSGNKDRPNSARKRNGMHGFSGAVNVGLYVHVYTYTYIHTCVYI